MKLYVKDRTSNISQKICVFPMLCIHQISQILIQCDVHKYKSFSSYFITFLVADIATRNVTKVINVTFYYISHFYYISCRKYAENQALPCGVSAILQSGLVLENIRTMFLLSR